VKILSPREALHLGLVPNHIAAIIETVRFAFFFGETEVITEDQLASL
jgi:hypothetical protein